MKKSRFKYDTTLLLSPLAWWLKALPSKTIRRKYEKKVILDLHNICNYLVSTLIVFGIGHYINRGIGRGDGRVDDDITVGSQVDAAAAGRDAAGGQVIRPAVVKVNAIVSGRGAHLADNI